MYRIGFPLWKTFARLGMPLKLRIDVMHDSEADVFVATSNDLRGLVCEAQTPEDLYSEITAAIDELMAIQLESDRIRHPHTDMRLCIG